MFVCHDVRVVREALVGVLEAQAAVEVAGSGALSHSTVAALSDLDPHIVLLTASDRATHELRALRAAVRSARLVVLGLAETESNVLAYAEAGMDGYVTHDASVESLVGTLEEVMAGAIHLPAAISGALVRRVGTLSARRDDGEAMSVLTVREAQIAALISEGLSNKEIAAKLSIEVRTVKNHVHNILRKLQLTSRTALIRLVLRTSWPTATSQREPKVLEPSLGPF